MTVIFVSYANFDEFLSECREWFEKMFNNMGICRNGCQFCESSMKFPEPNELFIIQSLLLLVIHSLAPMTVGLKSISLLGR